MESIYFSNDRFHHPSDFTYALSRSHYEKEGKRKKERKEERRERKILPWPSLSLLFPSPSWPKVPLLSLPLFPLFTQSAPIYFFFNSKLRFNIHMVMCANLKCIAQWNFTDLYTPCSYHPDQDIEHFQGQKVQHKYPQCFITWYLHFTVHPEDQSIEVYWDLLYFFLTE